MPGSVDRSRARPLPRAQRRSAHRISGWLVANQEAAQGVGYSLLVLCYVARCATILSGGRLVFPTLRRPSFAGLRVWWLPGRAHTSLGGGEQRAPFPRVRPPLHVHLGPSRGGRRRARALLRTHAANEARAALGPLATGNRCSIPPTYRCEDPAAVFLLSCSLPRERRKDTGRAGASATKARSRASPRPRRHVRG